MKINHGKLKKDLIFLFLGIFGFIVLRPNIIKLEQNTGKTPFDYILNIFTAKNQIHSEIEMQIYSQNFLISILYYGAIILIILGLMFVIFNIIDENKFSKL